MIVQIRGRRQIHGAGDTGTGASHVCPIQGDKRLRPETSQPNRRRRLNGRPRRLCHGPARQPSARRRDGGVRANLHHGKGGELEGKRGRPPKFHAAAEFRPVSPSDALISIQTPSLKIANRFTNERIGTGRQKAISDASIQPHMSNESMTYGTGRYEEPCGSTNSRTSRSSRFWLVTSRATA